MIEEDHSRIRSSLMDRYFYEKTHLGSIPECSVSHSFTGPCGETMEFFLTIEGGVITDLSFLYEGCGVLAACGSAACVLVKGKHLREAARLTQDSIKEHLGIPSDQKVDCPKLAAITMQQTVQKYLEGNRA
jgi:nitrogen fixation NifU-like protein